MQKKTLEIGKNLNSHKRGIMNEWDIPFKELE